MNPRYKVAISRMSLDKKIPTGDPLWPKFNSSFDNVEIESGEIVQYVYDGFPLTTWHKDRWRDGKNYICGQHIGLDFDNGTSLQQLMQDKFITRYGSFIHTTMSHTDEHPRSRAMFLLDQPIMQAKNYALAAASLLWMFGEADRQCKDAVRFWYGSPGCQFEYFDEVLPVDTIKRLINNYLETGANERKKIQRTEYQAPASQQEVAQALSFIPPWQIDYDEWVSVLMAIHSHFGDGGYSLAESWGDGKGDEIERKFKSFKETGNTSGAVTIATLFGIAKRFGWRKANV